MEKSKKQPLSIVIADNSKPQEYIEYLNTKYDVSILDVSQIKDVNAIDLILFTGGADVDPDQYEEPIGKYTSINKERDAKEIDIFYKFRHIPKLGICRGAQLLTVLAGGKLIQHVEGHGEKHYISIKDFGDYMIPSTHHQMMYPYELNRKNFELKAWSSNFRSTTYLDGNNKEIETPIDFLEPEIVEYPSIKALCIQGHPETGDKDIKEITLYLLSLFLEKSKENQYSFGKGVSFGKYNNGRNQYVKPRSQDDLRVSPFSTNSGFDIDQMEKAIQGIYPSGLPKSIKVEQIENEKEPAIENSGLRFGSGVVQEPSSGHSYQSYSAMQTSAALDALRKYQDTIPKG